MKSRSVIAGFLCLAVLSYCASNRDVPLERWFGMEFIIDGRVDIQLVVPPAKTEVKKNEPQFINSSPESFERLFIGSYDPGWGRDRDLLLTTIESSIKRIEPKLGHKSGLSLEYLKNNVYLARDDAANAIDIVGEATFNDQPWLRIDMIGGPQRGISYATTINGEYILLVRMTVFGENADQKSLYTDRHETLKKIISSVKFSTE